jgi:predicted permease
MSTLRRWLRRLTTTFGSGRAERELNREVASHLALIEDDFRRRGLSADEARAAARRAFGGVEQMKERQRDARSFVLFDQLKQDVRYALRSMRRAPGFAAAVVLTLALGIGANTAIFSLLDAVLLKSLPVREPGRLYYLAHGTGATPSLSANYPLLERYRANLTAFDGIAAYNTRQFKVSTDAGPELVDGQFVSGNYHDVLGVPIALGRGFVADADRPDGNPVAVISDGYWARHFGRDPGVLGRALVVQGRPVSIVGVTAAGFHGARPGTRIDVTLTIAQRVMDDPAFLTMRDSWTSLYLVGRLTRGATSGAALAEMQSVFRRFWEEPENKWARGSSNEDHPAVLMPAGRGWSSVRQNYRESLRLLMAMVAVVLLIGCSNVANLLLARAAARTREVAVRMSIGASRGRLVRQFLTESVVLAVAGGAAGLIVAMWGTRIIAAMLDAGTNPIVLDPDPDARVLTFTMAVSLITGVVFGLAPAIKATRVDVTPSLRGAASAAGSRRTALGGRTLVVCQVALCLVLLAGGALLVRSLINLRAQDTGFRHENLLLFYLDARGSQTDVMKLHEVVLDRERAIPGVRSAALSTMSPLATDEETRPVRLAGPTGPSRPRPAVTNRITPDYLSTLGIPVVKGRGIAAQDSATAVRVAVVNETMERDYFDGVAIGRTFTFGLQGKVPVTVVGVVRDSRQRHLRQAIPPMAFVPLVQAEESPRLLTASLRIDGEPRTVEALVRQAVRATSPDLVVSYVRTMQQQVDASLMPERLLATMSSAFVTLSIVLAAIGLYGVMSYGVARRVQEIGVRMALGASRGMVMRQVLTATVILSGSGIVIGLVSAYQATRLLSSFLYGVTDRDPVTFAAAAGILFAVSVLAGYIPARRATRIDPLTALRSE